jgi:5'-3' exonuclease
MIPTDLIPLIDSDILRYECAWAGQAGWKHKTGGDDIPPFSFVEAILLQRIEDIKTACNTSKDPVLYYTSGRTFRYDIAKRKPYKGTRQEVKPFHYNNITVYLRDVLGAREVTGIEADDAIAIDHAASNGTTIVVSRDKDLRQLPGWSYGWELGKQPSFGPELITKEGYIKLSPKRDKIVGTGLSFFYSQVLTGDATDNIPGLPNCGPVAAFELLQGKTSAEQLKAVSEAYYREYGLVEISTEPEWQDALLEQGRLCWLVRKLNEDGSPRMWEIGMED